MIGQLAGKKAEYLNRIFTEETKINQNSLCLDISPRSNLLENIKLITV